MIDAIELKNWKTHKETSLKFSKGTNILLGQMGAGKSTIMDAISFAFFGIYPAIQHRKVGVDEIIMNRPEQKKQASVRLEFEVDGTPYVVERNLELNGSTRATISQNGKYLQSQPQRVNEEVERILKIDYDLFSRAIYSEQNKLGYFLELRPAERKKQIDELLGLDKFVTAHENATSLVNKIKDMISNDEKTIASFDIEKLKEHLSKLQEESTKLSQIKKELEEELKVQDKKKSDLEKKLDDTKILFTKKTELQKEITELKGRINLISKEIEKITKRGAGDKASLKKALSESKTGFESLKKEEKEIQKEENDSYQRFAQFEAEQKTITRESEENQRLQKEYESKNKAKLEENLKKKNEQMKQLTERRDGNIGVRNENKKWLEELKNHLGKCPICERDLPPELRKKILEDRETVIKKMEQEIQVQTREASELEKESDAATKEFELLKKIEEKLKEYKNVDQKLKEIREKILTAREENSKFKKKREEANEALLKMKDTVSKLETEMEAIERMEEYLEDKDKDEKSLKQKEQEESKMDVSEENLEKLRQEFTSFSVKSKELATKLDANSASAKEKTLQLNDKKREVELVEGMHEQVKLRKRTAENLTRFREALQETQTTLRTKLIGSINQIMQEIWPELYPYLNYHGLVLEPTAEDYILKVKTARGDSMRWENVDTIASGGEKSIASLAMRVAFALVLVPNLRWIILDEPTHNIDQEGLGKFVKTINEVLPKIVDQVFIITHDEALKQVVNARIYVLSKKSDEGSTIVEAY